VCNLIRGLDLSIGRPPRVTGLPGGCRPTAPRNLATIINAYDEFLDLALGKDNVSHHLVTKLLGQETHRLADLEAAQTGGGCAVMTSHAAVLDEQPVTQWGRSRARR